MRNELAAKLDDLSAASWRRLDELERKVSNREISLAGALQDAYITGRETESQSRELVNLNAEPKPK